MIYNTTIQTVTVPSNGEGYQLYANATPTQVVSWVQPLVVQYNTCRRTQRQSDCSLPDASPISMHLNPALSGWRQSASADHAAQRSAQTTTTTSTSMYGWYYPGTAGVAATAGP